MESLKKLEPGSVCERFRIKPDFEFDYFSQCCKQECVFLLALLGPSLYGGPVVGRALTVAPRRAMLPPDFSRFHSHDSSVCLPPL